MCWPGPSRWRCCGTGCRGWPEADADRVAAALGDLPLALAQAAGYMAETGMPAGEYVDLLGRGRRSCWMRGGRRRIRGRWRR